MRIFVISLIVMVTFVSCGQGGPKMMDKDTVVQGFTLKGGTMADFFKDGKLKSGTLGADTNVRGVTLKKGDIVELNENGKINYATLSNENNVYWFSIPAGGLLSFDDKGKVNGIKANVPLEVVSNLIVPAGTYISITNYKKIVKEYDKDKEVSATMADYLILPEDAEVMGLVYKAGTKVMLSESGRPYEGIIAKATDLYNCTVPAGSLVNIDAPGNGIIIISAPTELRGATFAAGAEFAFTLFAKVRYVRITNDSMLLSGKLQDDISILYFSNKIVQ